MRSWSVFILISSSVLLLGYIYLGRRLIGPLRLSRGRAVFAWILLAVPILLQVFAPYHYRQTGDPMASAWISWPNYVALGFLALLFFLLVLSDLLLVTRKADPERRRFLRNGANLTAFVAAGGLTAAGFHQARRTPGVVERDVPVKDLPDDLEGFTIAQITDLHVGPTIHRDYVEAVVERVNALNADVVALTGDMVDGLVPALKDHVAPLAGLRARLGKFYVTGNHEYYWGALEWVREFERLGLTPLLNEGQKLTRGIWVAGVTDPSSSRFMPEHVSSPMRAMEKAPADCRIKLLLAHQPKSCDEAAAAGFDLQLSGHTHAGQFIPWVFFVRLVHPYTHGLHRIGERMQLYVSAGTGYWGPPLRLGTKQEITLLTLRKA